MRVSSAMASAITAAVTVFAGLGTAAPAGAGDSVALNGTYVAQSNGDWAQTNDRYQNEATNRDTWTVASSCSDAMDCAGRVTSDQGWSAQIHTTNGLWYLTRTIDNWEPCYDGSTAPGNQIIKFYPVDTDGQVNNASTTYAGEDKTISPSGSCGRNESLIIRMPFELQKIG